MMLYFLVNSKLCFGEDISLLVQGTTTTVNLGEIVTFCKVKPYWVIVKWSQQDTGSKLLSCLLA